MANQSKVMKAKAQRDYAKESAYTRFKMAMQGQKGGSKSSSVFLKEYGTFTASTWKSYTRKFYDRWRAEEETRERLAQFQSKKRRLNLILIFSFFLCKRSNTQTCARRKQEELRKLSNYDWATFEVVSTFLISFSFFLSRRGNCCVCLERNACSRHEAHPPMDR